MAIDAYPSRSVPRHPVPGPHNETGGSDEAPALPCLLDVSPDLIFTTSGRAAILLGLEALALGPGDRVLVPSYHCPTMVSPVLALGHQVGFYPIDEDGRPNLQWLEQNAPADVRVLSVVHFFGLPLDLRDVQAWCRRRGVLLMEDCAHAMFGRSASHEVGALGDVVIASLPKFFATLDGGLLHIRQPRQAVRRLQPAGAMAELKAWINSLETSERFGRLGRRSLWARPLLAAKRALRRHPDHDMSSTSPTAFDPDGDYARIDTALSHRAPTAVTVRAAKRSVRSRIIAARREHYGAMVQALSGFPGLRPLFPALPSACAPYVFPLWVDEPDPAYQAMKTAGVPVSRWDWLWPGVPDLRDDHGKQWSRHVLQLHCHQDMNEQDRLWMVNAVLLHCTGKKT